MRRLSVLLLLTLLPFLAGAQGNPEFGLPADIYYLMPSFQQGTVFFSGQLPAQGQLNICAIDHSVRFLDDSGRELEAANMDNIVRVQIDTAVFVRDNGIFYRLTSPAPGTQVAVKRDVQILKDTKKGAYGGDTRTSSVKEYTSVYADGVMVNLSADRTYPYTVSETLYLFSGGKIYPLTKRGLRKCFPDRKADIDAWLADHPLPETLPEAREMLQHFME